MKGKDDNSVLTKRLRSIVSSYLDIWVSRPSLETTSANIEGQARIASLGAMILILWDSIVEEGTDLDKEYLSSLSGSELRTRIDAISKAIEEGGFSNENKEIMLKANEYIIDGSSRKFLMGYLAREYNWTLVSLLSASYISTFVLMRAVFESVIGLGTRKTGSMGDRIDNIGCLNPDGKKRVKKLWYRLSAWCHPYGRWIKDVCPVYIRHKAIYHPGLFTSCLSELIKVSDLLLVVAIEKFELDRESLLEKFDKDKIDLTGFDFWIS